MFGRHRTPLTRIRGPWSARLVAALAAALLMLALPGAPVGADSTQTKKQLDAALSKLHKLEAKIAAQRNLLDGLRTEATVLAGRIDQVQSRIARTQFLIVKKELEIQDAQDELDATQAQLDHRAWVAYENGPGSSLDFLLGATSLSDLSARLEIVDRVAQSDQDLITQIQSLQARLVARQGELIVLERDLRDRRAELLTRRKALEAKIAGAQAVENQLAADGQEAASLVSSLRDKFRRQKEAERLAALMSSRGGAIGGVLLRCPVNGFVVYSDDFGAPRFSGGFHPHAGQDMVAARGTPVVAPFPGLAQVASNGIGGLAVKVYGAAGYVYNAHLDSFTGSFPRGVSTGEQIGTVGDSGNARGGITHDHFEWHPNVIPKKLHRSPYGYTQVGSAIDPYPYLNSVCR
jgi:peptidoglycan hydrolase CwlO-like protein